MDDDDLFLPSYLLPADETVAEASGSTRTRGELMEVKIMHGMQFQGK